MSDNNAKNRLKELLESLGSTLERGADIRTQQVPPGAWESTVTVKVPGLPEATGSGRSHQRRKAEIAAAEVALRSLRDVGPDWPSVFRDAQAGDALLKLSAYLAEDLGSAEAASRWLQACESDDALASVYDQWKAAGDEDLLRYGPGLGTELKASLVEALLWRRFGARVLGPEARSALAELRAMMARPSRSR